MLKIPGYTLLETIHKGKRVTVFRAFKSEGNAKRIPYVIKTISGAEGFSEDESLDLRGYRYQSALSHPSINRIEEIIALPGLCAIVSDDVGGISIAQWMKAYKHQHGQWMLMDHALLRPHLLRLMTWAIQITEALVDCHRRRLIHNGLSLSNIIVNPQKDAVQLIDFGKTLSVPDALRYTNSIDYRTDFYDLGVVLYLLFGGEDALPDSDVEVESLCHRNPMVPDVLSNVVQRLMESEPAKRYQNGKSVVEDLQRIYSTIKTGSEWSSVQLVGRDIPESLYLPNTLYGVEGILSRCEQWVNGEQRATLVCVSGPAGVGKTAVMHAFLARMNPVEHLCLSGQCEQFSKRPHDGLVKVLMDGVAYLLSRPEPQLAAGRESLREALGSNVSLLLDLVPDSELLLSSVTGEGAAHPLVHDEVPVHFAKLAFVVSTLLNHIADRMPVLIFLDDMQWCNDATYPLLEAVMVMRHPQITFFLSARKDEHEHEDVLTVLAQEMAAQSVVTQRIDMGNLSVDSVQALLADTFHSGIKSVEHLAALTVKKTHGNPFFIREFLKAAYQKNDGTLYFDSRKQIWEWSSERLASVVATGNVIEVLLNAVGELPHDTQVVLSWSAFLNGRITLKTMEAMTGFTEEQCQIAIESLKQEGVLQDRHHRATEANHHLGRYQFVHDRVQDTIYRQVAGEEGQQRHLAIAEHYMDHLEGGQQDRDKELDLLRHITLAVENDRILHTLPKHRAQQMVDRLEVGATQLWLTEAHDTRLCYLRGAHRLLTESAYQHVERLAQVLFRLSEAEYIAGDSDNARRAIDSYREIHTADIDQARSYYHQMNYEGFDQGPRRIVMLGLQALACLGVDYPSIDEDFSGLAKQELDNMEGLLETFVAFDPEKHALSSEPSLVLLQAIYARINLLSPRVSGVDLFIYGNLQGVRTILQGGCTSTSPELLMNYAIVLIMQGQYQTSKSVSLFAMALIEENQLQNCGFAKAVFGGLISRHFNTLRQCGDILDEAEKINRERGDHQLVSASKSYRVMLMFMGGPSLLELKKITDELRSHSEMHDKTISGGMLYWRLLEQLVDSKCDNYLDAIHFDGTDWHECNTTRLSLFLHYLNAQRAFFRNDYLGVLHVIEQSGLDEAIEFARDLPIFEEYQFVKIIATLQSHKGAVTVGVDTLLHSIASSIQHLEQIADLNVNNYGHYHRVVCAEVARVKGDSDASNLYHEASELAKKNGAVAIYALANELHGFYWSEKGRLDYASLHCGNAMNGYSRWGCDLKMEYLEMISEELFSEEAAADIYEREDSKSQDTFVSPVGRDGALDNISYLKISNAIAEEINLTVLLEQMILVVLENVGAEEGFLLLKNNEEYELFSCAKVGDQGIDVVSIGEGDDVHYPISIVNYCSRSMKTILLDNASEDTRFNSDSYFSTRQVKSLLGFPIEHMSSVSAVFVLTNNSVASVFSQSHVNFISALAPQFSVSIENARLYDNLKKLNRSLEDSIEHQTEELNAANDELRDFSTSVSHDLKSPLRQIYGLSYSLKSEIEVALPGDAVEYIQHVCDATERMGRIIDGLLMLSKSTGSTLQWESINLSDVVKDQLTWLENMEPDRNVTLAVEEGVMGYGDLQLLHQVVDNLLSNAWKYTQNESAAAISFGQVVTEKHDQTYFVRDNGAGFDMHSAVDMFKPFRRFHSTHEFEGTGIGLATVSRIINRHGGEIWAESQKGQGATFYFTLNYSVQSAENATSEAKH